MHQQVKGKCTGYLTETILIRKTSFFVYKSIPIPIAKTIKTETWIQWEIRRKRLQWSVTMLKSQKRIELLTPNY